MRHYYIADAIRAAEAPLLASLPDGVLMRRAAYGLTTAIAAEIQARTGALAGRQALSLGAIDITIAVAIFFIGEILLARLFYRLGLREQPY